jgi:hypothetical protein
MKDRCCCGFDPGISFSCPKTLNNGRGRGYPFHKSSLGEQLRGEQLKELKMHVAGDTGVRYLLQLLHRAHYAEKMLQTASVTLGAMSASAPVQTESPEPVELTRGPELSKLDS